VATQRSKGGVRVVGPIDSQRLADSYERDAADDMSTEDCLTHPLLCKDEIEALS